MLLPAALTARKSAGIRDDDGGDGKKQAQNRFQMCFNDMPPGGVALLQGEKSCQSMLQTNSDISQWR